MRRDETETVIAKRTTQLTQQVTHYLDVFDRTSKFTGPSVYFHHKTVQRLRNLAAPSVAVRDQVFLEYLYATLTAWGLHRMGPKGAKLSPFETFAASLNGQANALDAFQTVRIESVTTSEVPVLVQSLWQVIDAIEVSATESKVVAGSKSLHHLLPNLVPPIDREYTAKFFLWRNQMQYRQREMFSDVFPRLVQLAKDIAGPVASYIGSGFNTSLPKVVDNAIVGFMLDQDTQ